MLKRIGNWDLRKAVISQKGEGDGEDGDDVKNDDASNFFPGLVIDHEGESNDFLYKNVSKIEEMKETQNLQSQDSLSFLFPALVLEKHVLNMKKSGRKSFSS